MRAPLAALAGIGGSVAVVFLTSILPLPLLLRVGHWFPPGDPRLVIVIVQAISLALVLVVLRVPVRSLLRGLPPRQGIEAGGWLTLGTLLFSLLVSMTIASTSSFDARSGSAELLARWAREFPATGLAGHFAFYTVFVPLFEELLYRVLILGCLLRASASLVGFGRFHASVRGGASLVVLFRLERSRVRPAVSSLSKPVALRPSPQRAQSRFFGRGDPAGRLSARHRILDADGVEAASASIRLDVPHSRVLCSVSALRVCEDGRRSLGAAARSRRFSDAGHNLLTSSTPS